MGLFDFFINITMKFKNKEVQRLPEAQYINSATAQQPFIHENAYIEAYTRQLNSKPFNIISLENNGKVMKMKNNEVDIKVNGIKKLKESLPVEDGRKIDLYRGILEKDEKKKLVYFGMEDRVHLDKALLDGNKKYKVSNKLTKMFTIPQTKTSSKFIGSIVEDEIYKNYSIAKSNRLENYVNKIEENRIKIMKEKKNQIKDNNESTIKKQVKTKKMKK